MRSDLTNTTNINLDQLVGAQAKSNNSVTKATSASNTDLSSFIASLTSLLKQSDSSSLEALNIQTDDVNSNLSLAVNIA